MADPARIYSGLLLPNPPPTTAPQQQIDPHLAEEATRLMNKLFCENEATCRVARLFCDEYIAALAADAERQHS